jgi:diacylglycerol kinase (ATP)
MRVKMAPEVTADISAAPPAKAEAPAHGATAGARELPRMDRLRDAVIIFNPAAGRRRHMRIEQLHEARRVLKEAGVHAEMAPTCAPGSATAQARAAVAHNADLVIASGGDGTINEVVNGLAGSQVPLFILPAGTANVLAKELALPWDVREAARFLAGSRLRRIALGAAVADAAPHAPRYFISLAGAGSDGEMVHSVNQTLKRFTGQLAYWAAGFALPFRYHFPFVRVTSDQRSAEGSVVVIGRTKHYGGPIQITTRAELFAEEFEVAVFEVGFWGSLRLLPSVLLGMARGQRGVHMWKTRRVRCEAPDARPVYAQVDGEGCGALPIEFRIVPDALTLVVPGGKESSPGR